MPLAGAYHSINSKFGKVARNYEENQPKGCAKQSHYQYLGFAKN
jgi:hypothetical protein